MQHPLFGYVPRPVSLLDAEWDAPCALPFRAEDADADVLSPSPPARQPCPAAQARADRRRAVERMCDVRALLAARAEVAAKKAEAAAKAARAKADLAAARLAQAEDLLTMHRLHF